MTETTNYTKYESSLTANFLGLRYNMHKQMMNIMDNHISSTKKREQINRHSSNTYYENLRMD